MTTRVAVTGMGIICSAGNHLGETWSNITEGLSKISLIEQTETEHIPIKIAGEIKNFALSDDVLPLKEQGHFDRFIHLALHACDEALTNAGLKEDKADYRPEEIGAILGVGVGGFPVIERSHKNFLERGSRRVSPFLITALIPNMAPGAITIRYGLKGINYSISSACAASAHAIGAAMDEIKSGTHQVMVTGGAESSISPMAVSGFARMGALSRNPDPAKASRPFDKERDGFVMGEGSGILILENLGRARARGAKIYAELVGYATSSDAYHIAAPEPKGEGAAKCMKKALANCNLRPEDIDYINAHGTSTPLGDKGETEAIKDTFGKHAYKLAVSSTKSMVGHLLGGAGGVESVFCVEALRTSVLPPTINLETKDPDCDLDYIPNKSLKRDITYVMNNSFGFGGTNCSLIFKKYDQ